MFATCTYVQVSLGTYPSALKGMVRAYSTCSLEMYGLCDGLRCKTHPTTFIASAYNHVISYDVSCICNLIGLQCSCRKNKRCMCTIPDHSSQSEWVGTQTMSIIPCTIMCSGTWSMLCTLSTWNMRSSSHTFSKHLSRVSTNTYIHKINVK